MLSITSGPRYRNQGNTVLDFKDLVEKRLTMPPFVPCPSFLHILLPPPGEDLGGGSHNHALKLSPQHLNCLYSGPSYGTLNNAPKGGLILGVGLS